MLPGTATGQRILRRWLEKELNNVFAKEPSKRLGGWVVRFEGWNWSSPVNKEMGQRVNAVRIGGEPSEASGRTASRRASATATPTIPQLHGEGERELAGVTMHSIPRDYLAGAFTGGATGGRPRQGHGMRQPICFPSLEGYDYEFR